MSEEKRIILEMVKDGKISVDEAEQLLDKAEPGESIDDTEVAKKPRSRKFLRIRVTEEDQEKVNIKIPMALAKVGLKFIPKNKMKVNGEEINSDQILEMIKEGAEGEIVNIDASDKGKNVKITIFID
ncbi:MAG TPA: hypothetical protein VKA34_04475 [Balneolales bacterium]|nr:hypothetical protein [Balneolales bacterium]